MRKKELLEEPSWLVALSCYASINIEEVSYCFQPSLINYGEGAMSNNLLGVGYNVHHDVIYDKCDSQPWIVS